ncbi:MAG: hypothetical protein NZ866_02635 [Patescibacteria group bacterium]|nr:hypothetical protein [Patescibacteria group bacterium]
MLKTKLFIILLITINFILIFDKVNIYAQNFAYTLLNSQNRGMVFRYNSPYGNYNFEISKDSRDIPTIYFYSTNTNNEINKHKLTIKSFYGRGIIYSQDQSSGRIVVMDFNPGSINLPLQGNFNFYYYPNPNPSPSEVKYAKIYGNIENLIDIYTCEDNQWRIGQTCLGQGNNPNFCFGAPFTGKVIYEGLLMGEYSNQEAGLTICLRTSY